MKLIDVKKKPCSYLTTYGAKYRLEDNSEFVTEFVSRKSDINSINISEIKTDAVVIIAMNESKSKVLLIDEFRMAINKTITTFPAGLIDDGETAIEAATRELQEETGYIVKEVISESKPVYSSPGITDETIQIVKVIIDDNPSESNKDIQEEIKAYWFELSKKAEILESNIMDIRLQMFLDN